jgi:uncharacterized protein YbaA (DUF1428 family)
MSYIDGFVVPVRTADRETYRTFAAMALPVFMKHGALRCVECWGEDVPRGVVTDFFRSVDAKDDETVVFSWIEWPDKATRDAGMPKVMEDMPESMREGPMPFDGKRMIFGGFETLLDERRA